MNPKTAYLGCSMGIIYRDPEDSYYDEAEFAIVKGNTVFGNLMDDVRFYGELALVREGIEKIHEALPDYKYVPMRDVREAMYPEKMTTEQLAKSQGVQIVFDGKVIAGTRAKKVRSKSYNAFSSIDFPSLAVIQDGNIMRYLPMLPYEDEVRFYEELDENIFLMKLIPGIRPRVLQSIFENYDCIIVESFGVGGIPKSIADEFYRLCRQYPDKLVVMATQVAHEGSDMTVYEVGHDMKKYCRFLESYDMTLESVIAKTMWMLGNFDLHSIDVEDIFYRSINYDVIFGKNRKC